MAKSLTIPGVGAFLKDEIGKQFDGDYDMLWETARDREFPNQGRLRGLVASALKDMNSIVSMDEIEEVPLLQVALPVGFEAWDGETPIPVSYTPLTVDDVDVEELVFFDAAGNKSIIDVSDKDWEPDYPILIVGINERAGLQHFSSTESNMLSKQTSASSTATAYNEGIFIYRISVHRPRDLEPWWAGDLEMAVRRDGVLCLVNANVDNENSSCDEERTVGYFTVIWPMDIRLTATETSVDIEVFEDDAVGNDWVIKEGTLTYYNPSWILSVSDANKGDHYMCGDYHRCAYSWKWGNTLSTYDCSD